MVHSSKIVHDVLGFVFGGAHLFQEPELCGTMHILKCGFEIGLQVLIVANLKLSNHVVSRH